MKNLKNQVAILLFTVFISPCITYSQTNEKIVVDQNTFGAIEAREIGPAATSGRIAAIDAVQNDPRIVYVGSAGGGVWKTKNGGVSFKAVFDKYNQCIGAVSIDQVHPDTVWVGTGETWVRNTSSAGDGIYKTTNGGEDWKNMGLEKTERIARIIINPKNPDIVYVAALGHLFDPNEERGVYRTNDGGKTWNKILYVDENTGCADLAIDPQDPQILYAAMWDFRRFPYSFRSGGPGSGLYISRDGGENWTKVTQGMPKGTLGRIALSVSPVNPAIVYALIESEKSALYRSNDKGKTWEMVNETTTMGERPFYFSFILADPADTNLVYKPGYSLSVSENGGKNFRGTFVSGGNIHGDFHPLWISKKDNSLLYMGTDGGVYVSNDKGSSWRFMRNLPVAQFYHVSVDNEEPYNVYGGLQDNGSWMGPSKSPNGIENKDWANVGGGDGFFVFPDRYDRNILYWQYQGGNVKRRYKNTTEVKDIKPYAGSGEKELRFNWNTPIVFSPTRDIIYLGSQFLFRSSDKGDSWEKISPDLTTNDTLKQQQEKSGGITIDNSTAENYCTIFTIGESSLNPDLIWVGTDDGNIQLTKDAGKSWTNVTGNVPSLPQYTWVSSVCPSLRDAATAYATFDGHMTGDMKPYLYKTTDFGKTWVSLADTAIKGYCHKIIEDPKSNLLFLGTEKGLFVSIDGGQVWSQFKGNLPNVAVMDMVIQERENDLVLATHGRGIMIIDDITPLRQLNEDVLQKDVAFLDSRPYKLGYTGWEQTFFGDDEFVGSNPSGSSVITYYLKKRHIFGDMHLEIYNDKGEKIKELPGGKRKGINRVNWYMRMKPPKVPSSPLLSGEAMYGPTYPPGDYTVKMLKGDNTYEEKIKVVYDPAIHHSVEERDEQYKTLMEAYNLLQDLGYTDRLVTDIRDQAKEKAAKANNKTLGKKLNDLSNKMESLHKELVATTLTSAITGEEKLREKIAAIYSAVLSYQGKPTQSQVEKLSVLTKEAIEKKDGLDSIIKTNLPNLETQLAKENIEPFKLITKEAFLKEDM